MRHLILIKLFLTLCIVSIHAETFKAFQRFDNGDGTERIRLYLNYYDTAKTSRRLGGADVRFDMDVPLPTQWELLKVSGYISYDASLLMLKEHSSGTVMLNNIIIEQFKLFERTKSGTKFTIDPKLFKEYNTFTFHAIQHYTLKCEDPSSNQLWTNINLQKSYIDFTVRMKPIKEEIASLDNVIFDTKQYEVTPVNYIMTQNSDKRLKDYALFTAVASAHLKQRTQEIKASSKINPKTHNTIITTKEHSYEILDELKAFYIFNFTPSVALSFDANQTQLTDISGLDSVTPKEYMRTSEHYGHFDQSYIGLDNANLENDEMSASFWIRSEPQLGEKFLMGTAKNSLSISNSGIKYYNERYGVLEANVSLMDGKWHYVTTLFSSRASKSNRLFVDGRERTLTYSQTPNRLGQSRFRGLFCVGGRSVSDSDAFTGDIDQLYLFEQRLSESNVRKLYSTSMYHQKKALSGDLFLGKKLNHDIVVIQNPYTPENAIIIIAPDKEDKIERCISALYKSNLKRYKRAGLDINEGEIPEKALAYTSKNFLPIDEKIYFKELGFESTLLQGWYPPKVEMNFNVYPDNHFTKNEKIKLSLHYVFPPVIHGDSVLNIFLNDKFAKQIDIKGNADDNEFTMEGYNLIDWDARVEMPAYLIGKGYNSLVLGFSLVPDKKNECEVFNMENLVATVLDDSYFVIPTGKKWIEMPYLELIPDAAYPYAIYPDLQDTTFLLTNNDAETIAASMNFLFYLTQKLGSYPYYLNVSTSLGEVEKEHNIVAFGTIYDGLMSELSVDAPMQISENALSVNHPFIKKFVEHKLIIDESRNEKYHYTDELNEKKLLDKNVILQVTRSAYDGDKTIVIAAAQDSTSLEQGVYSMFRSANRNKISGDLFIYDYTTQKGKAYNIKEKYILSQLNYLDTMALLISQNPFLYLLMMIMMILFMTYILRIVLKRFRKDHHPDAE